MERVGEKHSIEPRRFEPGEIERTREVGCHRDHAGGLLRRPALERRYRARVTIDGVDPTVRPEQLGERPRERAVAGAEVGPGPRAPRDRPSNERYGLSRVQLDKGRGVVANEIVNRARGP